MTTMLARCEGAFIGHAIASKYDPSIYMALNVSDSLIEQKAFDRSDILSRHLYLYHTKKCEIGEVTRCIYEEALQHTNGQTRESFRFNSTKIDEFVKLADKKCDGYTAGCNPAQRSYPLAFCAFISDDDLYETTRVEAGSTHYSSLAGEVAGIVNLICRSLLKNASWTDAISFASTTPKLHEDIQAIFFRRHRSMPPAASTQPAYAPTILSAALNCVGTSKNAAEAISKAHEHGSHYCMPIVGILAGARWGIPMEMFQEHINDQRLKIFREAANKLIALWRTQPDSPSS